MLGLRESNATTDWVDDQKWADINPEKLLISLICWWSFLTGPLKIKNY